MIPSPRDAGMQGADSARGEHGLLRYGPTLRGRAPVVLTCSMTCFSSAPSCLSGLRSARVGSTREGDDWTGIAVSWRRVLAPTSLVRVTSSKSLSRCGVARPPLNTLGPSRSTTTSPRRRVGSLIRAATGSAPSTWGGAWRRGSGRVGGLHDIRGQVPLRRLPLSGRGHQPRRLALLPLSAELAHGRGD